MGCRRGLENCFEGTTCGNETECSNCTFEECEYLAEIKNSVAFAFHETRITQCKMCDSNELVRRTDENSTSAVYVKGIIPNSTIIPNHIHNNIFV